MLIKGKTRANQLNCLVTIFSLQTISYGEKSVKSAHKIIRKKQYIGIVYSYITEASLPISCKIKSWRYIFDSLVNIRLINKETCEHAIISV